MRNADQRMFRSKFKIQITISKKLFQRVKHEWRNNHKKLIIFSKNKKGRLTGRVEEIDGPNIFKIRGRRWRETYIFNEGDQLRMTNKWGTTKKNGYRKNNTYTNKSPEENGKTVEKVLAVDNQNIISI